MTDLYRFADYGQRQRSLPDANKVCGVVLLLIAILAVTLSGCLPPTPGPGPSPDPDPRPNPTPITSDAWLIVVEESADRTPATAEIIRALPTLGHPFRVYDDDSSDAAAYVAAVRQVRKPALLIVKPDGTSTAMALPGSVDALQRVLEGFR